MVYRKLGNTGLNVSAICLGTMQFGWTADEAASHDILDRAVELGCNFIDTADVYSRWYKQNQGGESETIIGSWLAKGSIRRDEIIIATKVRGRMGDGPNDEGLSRHHVLNAIEGSLNRLQTDYIDLYQVHSPDMTTPLEETLHTLDYLVSKGMVRYVGCSNYPAWLLMKSLWVSDVEGLRRFDTIQPHYNYIHRAEFERELEAVCLDQGIGVIPYSPLASGFLTGKYRRGQELPDSARAGRIQDRYFNDRGFSALEQLSLVAEKYEATVSQIAIAWLLSKPTISSSIIGANTVDQLDETTAGARVQLSKEDVEKLDRITSWK